MKKINLTNLLFTLTMCLLIVFVSTPLVGAPVAYGASAVMFAYSLTPYSVMPVGVLRNEVVRRIFSSDIQEKLFPPNTFIDGCQVDEGVAQTATEVDIPQDEDGDADSIVNPTQFPLQTVANEDSKKTYSVDLIATKPELVTDLNQAIVSYDKRAVKMRKHVNTLMKIMHERILFAWSPTLAENIRQTTSTDTRAAHAKGATGLRKRVSEDDFLWAMSRANDLDIPIEGRRCVVPSYMYEDVVKIMAKLKSATDGISPIVEKGAVGMLYTWNIYVRSTTVTYTEATLPVKKAAGYATSTTDNQAIIFYHPRFVRYAKGVVVPYINPNQGQYLGGTMNFSLRGGGTVSRLSETGVLALVEDNG